MSCGIFQFQGMIEGLLLEGLNLFKVSSLECINTEFDDSLANVLTEKHLDNVLVAIPFVFNLDHLSQSSGFLICHLHAQHLEHILDLNLIDIPGIFFIAPLEFNHQLDTALCGIHPLLEFVKKINLRIIEAFADLQ